MYKTFAMHLGSLHKCVCAIFNRIQTPIPGVNFALTSLHTNHILRNRHYTFVVDYTPNPSDDNREYVVSSKSKVLYANSSSLYARGQHVEWFHFSRILMDSPQPRTHITATTGSRLFIIGNMGARPATSTTEQTSPAGRRWSSEETRSHKRLRKIQFYRKTFAYKRRKMHVRKGERVQRVVYALNKMTIA